MGAKRYFTYMCSLSKVVRGKSARDACGNIDTVPNLELDYPWSDNRDRASAIFTLDEVGGRQEEG